jgi:hypothetical protein
MKVTDEPFGVDFIAGVMLIAVSTAAVTVRFASAERMLPDDALTVVLPKLTPVTTPVLLLIVAIAELPIAQVTWLVILAVVPSVYVPVAVKLVVRNFGTETATGLMDIRVKAGAVTVKVALLELTPLAEALMVVAPCARVDAIPVPFIVATELFVDAQTTDPETSAGGVPSEKVPIAVNVTEVPAGVDSVVDEMLIPLSVAVLAITDSVAPGAVMPPAEAVTVVAPIVTPVAKPVALLIVATAASPVAQVTRPVILAVVPSVKVPIAVNLVVKPFATEETAGLMAIADNCFTVKIALLEVMPFTEAITTVLPTATPLAIPVLLLIVATPVSAAVQLTWLVMSAVAPLAKEPVAVNCLVCPFTTVAAVGEMEMLASVARSTLLDPPPPPSLLQPFNSKETTKIVPVTSATDRCKAAINRMMTTFIYLQLSAPT